MAQAITKQPKRLHFRHLWIDKLHLSDFTSQIKNLNIETINHLKVTSSLLFNKIYYPNRCKNIVMTDFYIACNILKRGNNIVPPFSHQDIKLLMSHPATFRQICSFRQSRMSNMLLFFLGKMPSIACVMAIWCLGKLKKLV